MNEDFNGSKDRNLIKNKKALDFRGLMPTTIDSKQACQLDHTDHSLSPSTSPRTIMKRIIPENGRILVVDD